MLVGDAGPFKGESPALEWGDLNLGSDTGSITINRSVWHDSDSAEHVGSPEGGGVRRVPMTDRPRRLTH
jgi:hypothetical protein